MQRIRTVLATGAALVAAAACSRPAPVAADDALRADLAAAQAAAEGPAERTQFVSPLELGRSAEPRAGEVAAPRRAERAPARAAVARRVAATRTEPVARPVARVRSADPAPADERAAEDAPAQLEEPRPAAEPAPDAGVDEPVVGVPSRRTDADVPPPPRRRGRVWDMGDVIRNAPFPINPVRAGL